MPIHRFDQPRLNEQVSKLDCGDDTREFVKAVLLGTPFIIDNTNVIDGLEMRSPDGKSTLRIPRKKQKGDRNGR